MGVLDIMCAALFCVTAWVACRIQMHFFNKAKAKELRLAFFEGWLSGADYERERHRQISNVGGDK